MVEEQNFPSAREGQAIKKNVRFEQFLRGQDKRSAARAPITSLRTSGYRTSKLFTAPREVDEKP
jgi:hypothetical protein